MSPPEHALVLCCDDKSQVQALDGIDVSCKANSRCMNQGQLFIRQAFEVTAYHQRTIPDKRKPQLKMNRSNNYLQIAADVALVMLAWWIAFWLRFNLDIPAEFEGLAWRSMPWAISAYGVSWILTGLHRQVWRYTGLLELRQIALAVLLSAALVAAMILMLRYKNFPRSVMVLHPLVVVVFAGGGTCSLAQSKGALGNLSVRPAVADFW